MGDPISIIGALVAIGELAHCCKNTARLLHKFSRNKNIALDEIHRFCTNLRSFSNTVGLAHMELRRHCKASPDSPAFTYIRQELVLDTLLMQSKLVVKSAKEARDWVNSLNGSNRLMTTLRWFFKKDEILALKPEMEIVINRLQLIMFIVKSETIHMAVEASSTPVNDEEIIFLKDIIKNQMRTIEMLEEDLKKTSQLFRRSSSRPQRSSFLDTAQNQALVELGQSFANYGRPPPASPPTSTPQTSREPLLAGQARTGDGRPNRNIRAHEIEEEPAESSNTYTNGQPTIAPYKSLVSVSGYIVPPGRRARFVSAYVNNRQRGNRMSSEEARRLRLTVAPATKNDQALWMEDTLLPIQGVEGKVFFHWKASINDIIDPSSPGIECVVCYKQQPCIVFGRLFALYTSTADTENLQKPVTDRNTDV